MQLRYLTPFAFLALVPLGGWPGGAWTFMAAIATPLCLTSLDAALGDEKALTPNAEGSARWIPMLYIMLQIAATAGAAAWIARPQTPLLDAVGLAVSLGLTTGVFGFVSAHEMIHSRDRAERALGLTLLASLFYMHFRIAHVYGHHRRAATMDDPASARLGESLYAFLLRSVAGQFREAWAFEAQRSRRTSGWPRSLLRNRMVLYLAVEISFLIVMSVVDGRALAFVVAVAIVSVALLESFNYVAHYGLSRRTNRDGRLERLGPQHSWNSSARMNNAALFNMGRHSDHHRRITLSYARLEPLCGAAELPAGYASAMLIALVPPVWRRMMDDRAKAVMAVPLGSAN